MGQDRDVEFQHLARSRNQLGRRWRYFQPLERLRYRTIHFLRTLLVEILINLPAYMHLNVVLQGSICSVFWHNCHLMLILWWCTIPLPILQLNFTCNQTSSYHNLWFCRFPYTISLSLSVWSTFLGTYICGRLNKSLSLSGDVSSWDFPAELYQIHLSKTPWSRSM